MTSASADIIARSAQVKTRTARRPTQYRELVAKDHDLRLARAIAATPHQEPEHGTEGEVEKAQGHHGILTNSTEARSGAEIRAMAPFS